jgi:glutathione S-transferase
MSVIKVWGRRNSVNVQKIMWAIGEMNLEFERYDAAGSFGINDDYLKLNPSGTVPTIEDGDFVLWESNACVRYLAREYGAGTLYPENSQSIGLTEQWMDFQTSSLYPVFMPIFYNKVRSPPEKFNSNLVAEGIKGCTLFFEKLNRHLKNQDFLVGSKLSMGDVSIGSMMYRYYEMDIERPELKFVNNWYQRLIERPAYQKNVMIPFGSNLTEWLELEKRNAGIQ